MQSAHRIIISLVFLSSVFAGYHSSAKLRRDGVLNLYPFPRVGRSGTSSHWQPNDLLLEYEPQEKRLMSFPRVGRSAALASMESAHRDPSEYEPLEKRLISFPRVGRAALARQAAEQAGMWFGPRVGRSEHYQPRSDPMGMWYGPRIGRSFKIDDDDISIQNEQNASEPEHIEPTHEE